MLLCIKYIAVAPLCSPTEYMLSGFFRTTLYSEMQLHVLIYEAGQLFFSLGGFSENVCV
jgi:hypothetical protein